MSAGWIAQGADTPAPAGADAPKDPWTPTGPDTASTPALARPHQDPGAHPVDNTRGLLTRGKELLFGHEPDSAHAADQHYTAGILPSIGHAVGNDVDAVKDWATGGPDVATLASAYPHLVGAQMDKLKAGYQETYGAGQVQNAERQLAGYNVLPQVAARIPGKDEGGKIDAMAADPLVAKTARSLGISPQEFAGDWSQYAGLSHEQQADNAARAKDTLDQGQANKVAGRGTRNQAWADERVWQPSDLKNGKLPPWSLKGIAFNSVLAVPELAAVTAATLGAGALGGPGAGIAAGGATAAALFAPAQREDAKNQIDDQIGRLLEKADALDDAAPVGGKRGLNPVTEQLRQQAADLAASSDKIANTAGFLYAVSDAVGAVPVSAVLSKSPVGKAMLDRMVGAAVGKTVGGRIAGAMVANGAGGMLQAAIQKAVDTGIVHEQTSLADALKDMVYTGVTSAITAAPIAGIHEAAGAPGRAQARRALDSDELLNRVKAASDAMAGPQMQPGEDYPGYRWNPDKPNGRGGTGMYEPTATNAAGNATNPRLPAPKGPAGETKGPNPETKGPSGETPATGAAGARAAYQAKVEKLNTAAAAAEKRSDVTLEPEEEGWSVHVKGEPVAQFDTVEAAREAMAQARKVVGTQPAESTEKVSAETSAPSDAGAKQEVSPQPEDALERTQPLTVTPERRTATALRQRVDDMNPQQLKAALLTHELTGIPNRRAYDDAPKKAAQASVDVDSLKWINDHSSHAGGDELLKTVAQALHEETGGNAYHLSGDEFAVQGDSHDAVDAMMTRAKARLAGAVLTFKHPDGRTVQLTGVGLSHGTGSTLEEADRTLQQVKGSREAQGVRAARGEQPPNARVTSGEAGLSAGGGAPAEVLGQEVKKPAVPTPAQAEAGNYFKPSVAWHGLPIKVENAKGSYRRYVDAKTGKPGKRQMRAAYGFFAGTKGADADGIDVMMGPHHASDKAFVIDQLDHTGKTFDEHKVQVGVRSEQEAREQYLAHYPKGWKGLGGITELNPEQLKRWLNEGDLSQPIDPESVPRSKVARAAAPDARHDSILAYLARHPRGLDREEAAAQGIDPADMALAAAHVGIKRAFRKGGLSFDHAAESLHQAGYPVTDAQGHYSPNVLLDRLDDELRGRKHYSVHNDAHLPEAAQRDWRQPLSDEALEALSMEETRARIDELQHEQERLEREIERAGLNESSEHETADELDRIPFQRPPVKGPGVQKDLFGAVDHIKNELKRYEAALDKKRNSGQESVETGRPGDLFSQARKQTDLEDKPAIPPSVKVPVSGDRPTTLYRGTETGTAGVKRESSGGEIGRAIYATPHRWLAESYGGGPKAKPGAGRDVHEITLPKLPPEQYGYIVGGSIIGEKAKLVDHTGKVLHEYEGAKMSGAAERDAIRGIAEAAGIKVIVGDPESIGHNQVAILDPALIAHRTVTAEAKPKTGALEDAGEKIGGARKDKWAERGMRLSDLSTMTEAEAATLVNKKAVFNPDWQKIVAGGMDPKTAALGKILIDQLAARPRLNTPDGRRHYVEVLGRVRDMILEAKKPDDLKGLQLRLAQELGMPTGYAIASTPEQQLARSKFWSIQKGRRSSLAVAYSDLRKADDMLAKGWPAKQVKETPGETDKPKDKELPTRPHLDFINRVGPSVRTGDATSQKFVDDFGFRGLEFGNWAASDERQRLLNHAYDAMHDLARILNLPPKALSLNGTMGLALGARGGGRFAAHYESGKLVINMTKINGAGALAHEWGHALDHYMGELGRPDAYTTLPRGATGWRTDRRDHAHLRPDVQVAWQGVMEAMYKKQQPAAEFIRDHELALERLKSQGDQVAEAMKERPDDTNLPTRRDWIARRVQAAQEFLDELRSSPQKSYSAGQSAYLKEAAGLGEYWRRPTEMFARAFEGFVQDKIAAEGNESQYLVHGAKGLGYPSEDRPQVNAAIQKLVDTFETRSEGGKEALFRRGETPAQGMTVPAVRAGIDRILAHFGTKPDVTVVGTLSDLNDHPEVGHIVRDSGNSDAVAFVHPRTQKIYVIADQVASPAHLAGVLAHEYVTHYGLRAALGDRRNAQYQAILNGVAKAMPAELRIRGEQEFPAGFNPLNQHQRFIAAEEVLAYYGQEYAANQSAPARVKRWLDKLLGMLRDWIRSAWGLPQKFDELFVKRTLADLESFLRRSSSRARSASTESEPAFAGKEDTFFSGLAKAVDAAKREKGTGAEWEATLRNMPGVKAEELQWTGLKDWLAERGRVTKQEVADYIAAHRVQLDERLYGQPRDSEHILDEIKQLGYRLEEDEMVPGGVTLEPIAGGADDHLTDAELSAKYEKAKALVEQLHGGNGVQPPLRDVHIADVDQWMRAHGYPEGLDKETEDALRAGGAPTDDAIELLHRYGYDVTPLPDRDENVAAGHTKYGDWATPGGENYRELLLTLDRSPSLDVLAGREAVFAKYQSQIDAIDKQTDDYQHRGIGTIETIRDLNRERNRLMAQRDAEADAVGKIEHPTFKTQHWNEPNVLAHVRFDDRTGPNGERILHVHEVQSDWHQAGRREGYASAQAPEHAARLQEITNTLHRINSEGMTERELEDYFQPGRIVKGYGGSDKVVAFHPAHELPPSPVYWLHAWDSRSKSTISRAQYEAIKATDPARVSAEMTPNHRGWSVTVHSVNAAGEKSGPNRTHMTSPTLEYLEKLRAERQTLEKPKAVPDAPFKTTWPELAIKRMLRMAAEGGYDALSWDTGDTNAERYNMSQAVDSIHVRPAPHADERGNRLYRLTATKDGHSRIDDWMTPEKIVSYIGKDMTQKAISQIEGGAEDAYFKGDDLKVGGAGMRAFYDDILPKTVGKLVKKWGSSVNPGTVPSHEYGFTVVAENRPGFPGPFMVVASDRTPISGSFDRKEADAYAAARNAEEEKTSLPVHRVDITPQMRDSVMGGQPMFLKRRKGSSGTPPPVPKKGAYDLARRAIAAIPNNEFVLSLRRIADPAGVSPPAKATAVVTREALGELAQASEEALQNLERYAKAFDLLGTEDRYAFIDAMEGGLPQKNAELQPAADAIRALLDDWRERIRGLGVGALDNFIENYFPHIWRDDAKAKKLFGQIFGRRPLKGPASFLKERTIPTTREGLDAGLTPISTNPLVLAFAKLREMQRFYTGVKLMQRFKDEGLARYFPVSRPIPDGWTKIDDAVGRVKQWSEAEQGFIERGFYAMPTDAARVINNHLSSSALRNFLPAQIFRVLSNAVNALQLGFSAFHLGFTTLDAVISKNALAIERLLHGEPLKAAQSFLEAATGLGGAGMNLVRGRRLLKAYANTGAASPELRRIVQGLTAAGGRVKMDNYFQASQGNSPFAAPAGASIGGAIGAAVGGITGGLPGAFAGGFVGSAMGTLAQDVRTALMQPHGKVVAATQALTSFPQQYAMRLWRDLADMTHTLNWPWLSVPFEIVGRATRASTSIIMEHIVPLQKLGVFSDLAADHIRRNPLEDPVAFAGAMQRIWNSVDNRLGEMVYDNVFWNRTFKEVMHMMVRAVGWNLGTIRELGGAPVDVVKVLDYLARGAPAEAESPDLAKTAQARADYEAQKSILQRIAEKVGHKIPYTLALIGTTMILGAALTYLFTGKGPEETKDYFFPRTGRKTKYGTPERISMPSYMKDIYEYGTQPMTTVINKANPIFGIIHVIYANEDFFGNAVRNPDEGPWAQILEGAQYADRQVQPFSIQGTKQFVGAGDMDTKGEVLSTMPYVGFGPAPARVTSPDQMDRYQLRETEKSYIRGLQRRFKQATEKGDKEEVERLRGEIRESKLKERGTESGIRTDKIKARDAADKISSLIHGRSRADAVAALNAAGMPAFAQLWASMPDQPRPRVVQSLESFA